MCASDKCKMRKQKCSNLWINPSGPVKWDGTGFMDGRGKMEAKISVHCEGIEDDATENTCWHGVCIDGVTEGASLDA